MQNIIYLLKRYGLWQCIKFSLGELYSFAWKRSVLHSFSQDKEDLMLDKFTGYKHKGFYVDVGAYDPYRFSNTMRFYQKGWRGINIEPDTERWLRFQKNRIHDINLNVGIADKKGNLMYYRFDPPTLSTFTVHQAEEYQNKGFILLGKVKVDVIPLRDVFLKYAKNRSLDFMSIDVEGMEMQVLKSNNWKRFRPQILCIESTDFIKKKKESGDFSKIDTFLKRVGYRKIFDNGLNSFYKDTHHE